jgi:hypothetical protein
MLVLSVGSGMKKERIIEEIKRTASENGGGPLGQRTFTAATGITAASWLGRYWRNWSDALVEAGFEPNRPLEAHTDELLIQSMAKLTRQLRRFPTVADMRLERRTNDAFPSHSSSRSSAVNRRGLSWFETTHVSAKTLATC